MRHIAERLQGRLAFARRPLLMAIVAVALLHFATLMVVFALASGSDIACVTLLEESGYTDAFNGWTQRDFTYYVDPGYTCEYASASGETLVLRKDLFGLRNVVSGVTAVGLVAGAWYVRRQERI